MAVSVFELPLFEPPSVLESILASETPEMFLKAERSAFFKLMASAYDSKNVLEVFRQENAGMWRVFWEQHHEKLDGMLADPAPGRAIHDIPPARLADAHGQVVTALNEMFDSVFEMFGIAEYEDVVRGGTVAVPMSMLLPPLYVLRPSVEELAAVPPEYRKQVINLLQHGFAVEDALIWYTQVRFKRTRPQAYEQDRRRFAVLRKMGFTAQEGIDFIIRFPDMPVWKMVAYRQDGIPLDYITEMA